MQFKSLQHLDTAILYILELVSSLSVLLLAIGLISSMANVLLDGAVLQRNSFLSAAWVFIQCAAVDLSISGTIIRAFRSYREGDIAKTVLYGILSVLLLFVACLVSNVESVQTTLNITLNQAYTHVFIPVDFLIWIRSIVIVLLLVAHAAKYAQLGKAQESEEQQEQKLQITPDLVSAVVTAMQQGNDQVVEEGKTEQVTVPEPPKQITQQKEEAEQIIAEPTQKTAEEPETTSETSLVSEQQAESRPPESVLQELASLLPGIPYLDISAVVTVYTSGTKRRDIIPSLHWSASKYSSVVKPVLDTLEQLRQEV